MINNNYVIVSLTSWKKRIQNVHIILYSILSGTYIPDKIVINLSEDEFPLKEKELPSELLLFKKYNIVEINWVKENTKAFKKIIPTMKLYPNSIVLGIDDDIILPKTTLADMINKYLSNNGVIAYFKSEYKNISYCTTGFCTLYPAYLFNEKFTSVPLNIIQCGADDVYYSVAIQKENINITSLYDIDFLTGYNTLIFITDSCSLSNTGNINMDATFKLSTEYYK